MTKRCFLGLMVSWLACGVFHPAQARRLLSPNDAKELVAAALPERTRQLPKFGIDVHHDPDHPSFYFLSVTWAGAPDGSAMIGNYYVDQSTGDVWNAGTDCEELATPALRKLQARIRSKMGLSDSEYHRMRRKGPLCQ